MSRIGSGTHANVDPSSRSEMPDALAAGEQYLSKLFSAGTRDRAAKASERDQLAKANAKMRADFKKLPPDLLQSIYKQIDTIKAIAADPSLAADADRLRKVVGVSTFEKAAKTDAPHVEAKAPASGMNDNPFVAFADIPGSGARGAVDHLASHGISCGIKDGVLSLQRIYLPSATGLLAQFTGSRS